MRVRIQDLNEDGRGRGYDSNRAVLVPQTLPGDDVAVRVDRRSRTTLQGRVAGYFYRSPNHTDTPCPHVGTCTGCTFVSARAERETQFKHERLMRGLCEVDSNLLRVLRPIERPSELFGYRYFSKHVVSRQDGEIVFGSYVAGTHEIADMRGCPVLVPALGALLEKVRRGLRQVPVHTPDRPGLRYVVARASRATGKVLLTLVTSGDPQALPPLDLGEHIGLWVLHNTASGNRILDGTPVHIRGPRVIQETLVGFSHAIGPTSFFQVNPVAAERLFSIALDFAGSGYRCVEGYCGVGVMTLPLQERFDCLSANELNAESTALLRARAPGIQVFTGDAEAVLPRLLQDEADAVVLDPPRRGLGPLVLDALGKSRHERVVLLSCDPRTLLRDLPRLLVTHQVEAIAPVDQFPRTAHLETVTLLTPRR